MVKSTPLQQVDYLTQTHWTLVSNPNPHPDPNPNPNPSTNLLLNSIKICLVGDVHRRNILHKIRVSIIRGYDFTVGQIFDFQIDLCMGLTTVWR